MRPSLRFEVFKRDRFSCGYCGRTPPDVLLEVDHVVPRSGGGSDELENLLTACWDCNRGKGSKGLSEGGSPPVGGAAVKALKERVKQAKAYNDLIAEQRSLRAEQEDLVTAHWCKRFGGTATADQYSCDTYFPNSPSIARFIRALGVEAVLDAVDIAASKFPYGRGANPSRYFYGVCNRMMREVSDDAS